MKKSTFGLIILIGLTIATLGTLSITQHNQIVELKKNQIELDHLQETNPKAAKEFEEFMFHETE